MFKLLAACAALIVATSSAVGADDVALRRHCAHQLKVKLGIKDTGNVNDLRGVRGAIAQVDRCVTNRGKLD